MLSDQERCLSCGWVARLVIYFRESRVTAFENLHIEAVCYPCFAMFAEAGGVAISVRDV